MRFILNLRYNGHNYQGFQIQDRGSTIQLKVESALKQILGESLRVHPGGRTDTGVHALSQLIHFDTQSEKTIERIRSRDVQHQLNSVLPSDICILDFKEVSPEFNVKHSTEKHYRYHLRMSSFGNPFLNDYVWTIPKSLNLDAMKSAALHLIGKHDFTSFCASDSNAKTKVRRILSIEFNEDCPMPLFEQPHESYITIDFVGTGFLKQMVRNIVGTLVAVGEERVPSDQIKSILIAKDRRQAHRTAPPQGLFLVKQSFARS